MLRGINRQMLFEEAEDFKRFAEILSQCKTDACELYGYCLMDNHVHILISFDDRSQAEFFKRVGIRYAVWFNKKYDRIGHLFQDRYKSEPIEDDARLLAALRYIHQNPVKAGLCKHPGDYQYSSYQSYLKDPGMIDTELVLEMFSKDEAKQRQVFEEFMLSEEPSTFIDDRPSRLTDRQCKEAIRAIAGTTSIAQFQALSCEARNNALRQMKKRGLSLRQITRLTGTPIGIVRRK
jgi:REP element-mobilizing transposase RayT